jgi:proton-translocating NADH-quinone oxidoreductase chain N
MSLLDFIYVAPMLMLAASGLVVLILGTIADRFPKGRLAHLLPPDYLSVALMVPTVIMAAFALWAAVRFAPLQLFELLPTRNPLILIDPFAAFFGLIAALGTLVVMVMSLDYFAERTRHRTEYFALLLFATCAILLVAASTDLLMIYLSLEFLSLSSYVLAAYWKDDSRSSEAGIKYFLFGAVSSAVMLYGMSMLYGLTNSTNLADIASALGRGDVLSVRAAWVAVIMVLAGLGFKLALVPFHLWAPDTYEGAPTPITAWLSVASKAAGLAVATRFLLVAIPLESGVNWYAVLIVLSAASMTLGNLVAITQKNVKRMLAYSSIAQVGYMLVGVLAAATAHNPLPAVRAGDLTVSAATSGMPNYGLAGLLIYAASYLFMNLGAFAVVIALERKSGSSDLEAFRGLMRRAPFLAGSLVVFFLSLAGIPPTAGFLGKLYVFASAIQTTRTDLLVLAIIAVANSVISVYYYFNVVRLMFMHEAEGGTPVAASKPLLAAIVVLLVLTIGICLAAGPVIRLAQAAVL